MRYPATILVVAVALVTVSPSAYAERAVKIEAAPITKVTVYPGGARVTRTLELDFALGAEAIALDGLTIGLDPDSLRVIEAPEWLRLGSVEVARVYSTEAQQLSARNLEAEIEALEARKIAVADQVRAADLQLSLLHSLISEAPKARGGEEAATLPSPEYWNEMLHLIAAGAESAYEAQRRARMEDRELDKLLEKARAELSALAGAHSERYRLRLAIEASKSARAAIEVEYFVGGAGWRPLYDARLDSQSGQLNLTQFAEITQASGEDWKGVALELSTARPHLQAQPPEIETWFVDFMRNRTLAADELELMAKQAAPASEPQLMEKREGFAKLPLLLASEFQARYQVPGNVDVPADGSAHKVRLSESQHELALKLRAVPRHLAAAFLVGDLTWESEAPLIPGAMSIFRDGAFVASGVMPLLRPGQREELSFGVDERVVVSHRLKEGERGESGLIRERESEVRLYEIEVVNHHGRAIEIVVLDQMPVPLHEDIHVDLAPETTQPSEIDVDDLKGVVAWKWTAEPGEARKIIFGYRISHPAGRRIAGF